MCFSLIYAGRSWDYEWIKSKNVKDFDIWFFALIRIATLLRESDPDRSLRTLYSRWSAGEKIMGISDDIVTSYFQFCSFT
jgi:hypothetical protein